MLDDDEVPGVFTTINPWLRILGVCLVLWCVIGAVALAVIGW